jgi:poly(A) polymerase
MPVTSRGFYLKPTSFDLPDDVFQPGETRASRPKKKVTKRSETAGQKRSISELDVSVSKRMRSA